MRAIRLPALVLLCATVLSCSSGPAALPLDRFQQTLLDPPREYTLIPLWFWNDDLSEEEIKRQIDDFCDHGVYGFVIHPRIGLPTSIPFMSDRYLHFCRVAVDYAAERGMVVHLYDEGMYPSGSAAGQVVAADRKHAARCIVPRELAGGEEPKLGDNESLVAVLKHPDGRRFAVVDQPSGGVIRGVHYDQNDKETIHPPAGDILNPEATASFIRLVHDRFYEALRPHFGKTVQAIFTDEPNMMGRGARPPRKPWTTGVEKELQRLLGYDVRPHLLKLWHDLGGDTHTFRAAYMRAMRERLEETYYEPLGEWCAKHGIALTGHPDKSDDIGMLRHFQIPGQDVVWRIIEPAKPEKYLEQWHSTMGKCTSSAAIHLGCKRNANEAFGAYGWNLTYDETRWLTNWLLIRGVDMIWPHAFYYSIRGPRRDERPPDVGPNNTWWGNYREYSDFCRRACWLNAEGTHRADIAILGKTDLLPWKAAKVLFQNQRDFNYIEERHLHEDAKVTADAIRLGPMTYRVLIVDEHGPNREAQAALAPFEKGGRVIQFTNAESLLAAVDRFTKPDLVIRPANPDLRYRHVSHPGREVYLLFNEGESNVEGEIEVSAKGTKRFRSRLEDGRLLPADGPLRVNLPRHGMEILVIETEK